MYHKIQACHRYLTYTSLVTFAVAITWSPRSSCQNCHATYQSGHTCVTYIYTSDTTSAATTSVIHVSGRYSCVAVVPTCSNDLLLHFDFDNDFNDVTCHNAVANEYGAGTVTLAASSGRTGKVARFNGRGYLEVSRLLMIRRRW